MELKFTAYHPYPEFMLYDKDKIVAQSKLDLDAKAFRIRCFNTRRAFLIYDEVIKNKPVTTLLNKYSHPLAKLINTGIGNNAGTIELEGSFYNYRINDSKEVIIYKSNSTDSLLTCIVRADEKMFSLENYMNYILFSLVWFIYSSKEAKAPQLV